MYYTDKLSILRDLFSAKQVTAETDSLTVDGRIYPIVEDVIVLLSPDRWPVGLSQRPTSVQTDGSKRTFAGDIQHTFGEEWKAFSDILPEHEDEFRQYFDLVDMAALADSRVCDFGCGNGRWSWFLAGRCREIVLVDFSEAIFVARRNLAHARNALFFLGDITALPFRPGSIDFGVCLGVLHHLPTPALDEIRSLSRFASRLVVYVYYALDNRPRHFRLLFGAVTVVRRGVARVHHPGFRWLFTWMVTFGLYLPCIGLGYALRPLGWHRHVPLHETYAGKSVGRIRQDVYDRFFARIEQRFSRADIAALGDVCSRVVISDSPPYWHFVCER